VRGVANLDVQAQLRCKTLTYRAASHQFHISYPTWKAIREANGFLAFRADPRVRDQDGRLEARFLESVREKPHLSIDRRASELGCRVQSLQEIATRRGLANLNARLIFAGYRVEACKPLQVARQRRIVASYPGSLSHIDFKTFGFLRGAPGLESVRLGGFVVIDSLTSHASVHLAKAADAIEAVAALAAYTEKAPFPVQGIVLSDNGGPFVSEHWLNYCQGHKLIPRRIRSSHPARNYRREGGPSLRLRHGAGREEA